MAGEDLGNSDLTAKHAPWAEGLKGSYDFEVMGVPEAEEVVLRETGLVFERVLEDAGVFKRTPEGQAAFLRFLATI